MKFGQKKFFGKVQQIQSLSFCNEKAFHKLSFDTPHAKLVYFEGQLWGMQFWWIFYPFPENWDAL